MPSRLGHGAYRTLLASPAHRAFFGAAALARLGVAMSSLAVLWAVHGATGSFAGAGIATATFAAAEAVAGPQVARLIDRHGQRRVVYRTMTVFTLTAGALALACSSHQPLECLVPLAALLGASVPQVGALSASRWRQVVGGTPRMSTALSLEAALNDVTFMIGPILVTTLSAMITDVAGLILSTALVVAGLLALLGRQESEPPPQIRSVTTVRTASSGVGDPRLVTRSFLALFAVNLSMGMFFGSIPLDVTAFAVARGAGELAGVITAVSSAVSLLAGLAYGAVGRRTNPLRMAGGAGVVLTFGCLVLSAVPSVPAMLVGYGFVGGCVSLVLIPASILLQRVVARKFYTQAMTWMNSASVAGIAVAAPVVGLLIEHGSWRSGFVATAILLSSLPLTLAISHRALDRRER